MIFIALFFFVAFQLHVNYVLLHMKGSEPSLTSAKFCLRIASYICTYREKERGGF